MFILTGVVLAATFLTVMKIVEEIVSERFSLLKRHHFNMHIGEISYDVPVRIDKQV